MSEKGAVWMKNGEKTRGWKFYETTVTVGAGSKPALVDMPVVTGGYEDGMKIYINQKP